MLEKIQTLKESWGKTGQAYTWDHEGDETAARAEHLRDWAGTVSIEVWEYFQKTEGVLWQLPLDVIEKFLIKANGDLDKTVELIQAYLNEDEDADYNPRSETLTASERNPGLR